jgi:hypothetical protein
MDSNTVRVLDLLFALFKTRQLGGASSCTPMPTTADRPAPRSQGADLAVLLADVEEIGSVLELTRAAVLVWRTCGRRRSVPRLRQSVASRWRVHSPGHLAALDGSCKNAGA